MCGIAGLICGKVPCREEEHSRLVRTMCDLQRHRGPDDDGVVSLGAVCLGATRLSIIDLSAAGHIPMSEPSGRWWITYNGEVYNFRELRDELLRVGHTFQSQTDTEVVLHAFIEWGEACLDRFVGMFAFAIYDRATETLVLARDRFGIKPLYYTQGDGHTLFASELKALLEVTRGFRIDKHSLLEWFLYRNVDVLTPETLIENVASVLPGHLVTVKDQTAYSRAFYSPAARVDEGEYARFAGRRPPDVVAEIGEALHEATRARLVSDVPVGTLLSGGLDSSLVTAMAARHSNQLTAFNVSVSEYPAFDEKIDAEAVARHLGIPLISHRLTGEGFRRELSRVVYHSDLPLSHPNSVAYFMICRVARDNGVIVLLSGEGADELFGGYSWRYRRHGHLLRAQSLMNLLPPSARRWLKRVGYATAGLPVTALNFDEMVPLALASVDRYARQEWRLRCQESYRFVRPDRDRAVLGALLADLNDFITPLLRRLDRMSMAASTECRVPFLDHRLVEKVINLPLAYRVSRRSDKWVLKQIAETYLPRRTVRRPKVGFPLPLREYLEPLARIDVLADGFCSELIGLGSRSLRELMASWHEQVSAFFSLVTLEIWGRLYIWRQSIGDIDKLLERCESAGRVNRGVAGARAGRQSRP